MEIETTPAVELLRLSGQRAGMSDVAGTVQKRLCHTDRPWDPFTARLGASPLENAQ